MLPASTRAPSCFLIPSRLPADLRPFLLDPPAFFVAVRAASAHVAGTTLRLTTGETRETGKSTQQGMGAHAITARAHDARYIQSSSAHAVHWLGDGAACQISPNGGKSVTSHSARGGKDEGKPPISHNCSPAKRRICVEVFGQS
jgi:hypothetical protein